MADLKENQMMAITAANLRCLDSAGNSGVVPVSEFVRSDKKTSLSSHVFAQIAKVPLWERFAAMCVIGSSDAAHSCILRVTGTIMNGNQIAVKAFYTGNSPKALEVKLLYKIDDGILTIGIYSNLSEGSTNPFAIISSHPVSYQHMSDISGYTEFNATEG